MQLKITFIEQPQTTDFCVERWRKDGEKRELIVSVMTAERWSTYLCRRRNTPQRIKVPVTSIHPITTKLHKNWENEQYPQLVKLSEKRFSQTMLA
jgi:hypothetical protein